MNKLPIVELPPVKSLHRRAPWPIAMTQTLGQLGKYGLAEVKTVPVEEIQIVPRELDKWTHSFFVKVNGKLVWIDTWDYEHPVGVWISGKGQDIDVHCVLKIQYKGEKFPGPRQVPMYNWTMFHTDHSDWLLKQPERRKIYLNSEKEYRSLCSGRSWRNRGKWFKAAEMIDDVFVRPYPSKHRFGTVKEYIRLLYKCKTAVCLMGKKGRYTDGKNRREVECASLGMPMIMNYQPSYLNPLKADKHFIYVSRPEKLADAIERLQEKELADHISNNAYEWWENNASEKGICMTFMQIMKKSGAI